MEYQAYKNNGIEEVRLKPGTEQECKEIDDCSKCFFEEEHKASTPPVNIDEITKELINRMLNTPHNQDIPIEDIKKEMNSNQTFILELEGRAPNSTTIMKEIRLFTIKDGKVISDQETMEIMNELGIIDSIENSLAEENEEN